MNTASGNGLYWPGQTLLHRLDPRLKVLSSLLLVVLVFAAADGAQLLALALIVMIALWMISPVASKVWRVCWMLRWLFLFTLLMHLLLSPGRTLWGISWLSLDGLLLGFFVTAQMLLAVVISALLAITTSTKSLAISFGWFVKPLQWLGCRTDEWQKIVLLAMDFIPVIHEEIRGSSPTDVASPPRTWGDRWSLWMKSLHDFLMRLVSRGDTIAHRIAEDEISSRLPVELSPLLPMAFLDQLFSLTITLVILCYWFT